MKKKCNLLILTGGRSNAPLVDPVIERMRQEEWCSVDILELVPGNFIEGFKKTRRMFPHEKRFPGMRDYLPVGKNYDLVYIVGDRLEMYGGALACFYSNQPIIHLGGGILEGWSTWDELHRHSITMMATIELCEVNKSAIRIKEIWESIGKIRKYQYDYYESNELDEINIHVVGNLYLEGLDNIDESLVPSEEYDLALLNPETITKNPHIEILNELQGSSGNVILIEPNADPKIIEYGNHSGLERVKAERGVIFKYYKKIGRAHV